jgi:septal ring factor EnvC (AmiA/AmiB activator)
MTPVLTLDQLVAQVDDLTTAQRDHDARATEMESANLALQDKYDASFAAQGEMEEQLEGANDIIDHLRRNLDDVERQLRQQQRRYADQVSLCVHTPHTPHTPRHEEPGRVVASVCLSG